MNLAICSILGFIFIYIFGPYIWNAICEKEQNGDPNEFKEDTNQLEEIENE